MTDRGLILRHVLNRSPDLDRLFHALADPARRAIVERLSRGPATVSDLAKPFAMTLAAVVQHLQVLEGSGLVRSEKIGRVRTCRIDPGGLNALADWVAERRSLMERRFDRLGELLAEPDPPVQMNQPKSKEKDNDNDNE